MSGREVNMIYKSKKIFRGQVSVRSPIIESCIEKKEQLVIKYKDGEMFVPYEDILTAWTNSDKSNTFYGRYGGGKYFLVDFDWNPRKDNQLKLNIDLKDNKD
jgi:hypothetical protein